MAASNTSQETPSLRSPEQARELVLDVLRDNADSLLTVARRHSLCLDDAQDAYQRALEIFLKHAHRLEADGAAKWVFTVTKHEAMRLRATRQRQVPSDDVDLDAHPATHTADAAERVLAFDRVTRTAEALQRLKPQELRALWLQAQGLSYQEIADHCQWTYTKVNRCITEGRRSFLRRYAAIEAGDECRRWAPTLSAFVDGEAAAAEVAALRPHLRNCGSCQATVRELNTSRSSITAVLPLPVASAVLGDDVPVVGAVPGLLGRAWELLTGHLQERVVVGATKLQMAVEAATGGKVVAVAASAAALAGGGVAVEHAAGGRQQARPRTATSSAQTISRRAGGATATSAARVTATEFDVADEHAPHEFEVDHAGAAAATVREFEHASGTPASGPTATRSSDDAAEAVTAAEFGP